MVRWLLRIVVGLVGVLALLLAARIWISPAEPAARLGLLADGGLGLSTLRADVGGFFAAGGAFALAAAVRSDGRLLTPTLALLGFALAGRVVTVVLNGYSPDMLQPIIAEAVLVATLAFARQRLA